MEIRRRQTMNNNKVLGLNVSRRLCTCISTRRRLGARHLCASGPGAQSGRQTRRCQVRPDLFCTRFEGSATFARGQLLDRSSGLCFLVH